MSDFLANLAFLAVGGITAISAMLVVFFRNVLHAAVALFFCLAGVAGLYLLIGADFVGMAQLLIYAGGILVLIIFGVFMTARIYGVKVAPPGRRLPNALGLGAAVGLFLVLGSVIRGTEWSTQALTYKTTTAGLGDLFLTKYLLAFELVSVLLLFAMIGSIILVRKEMEEDK